MMNVSTFSPLLLALGFTPDGNVFAKHFDAAQCDITVDFDKKCINYPPSIDTGENTTTNFSQDENMVVLECVCALLEKGYSPKTIFLEKEWTLGHTGKGGRADITVYDKSSNDVLFIIECKTWGKEYNRAKKELFEDGAGKQLFSYAAQARSCKWLMLYASRYNVDSKCIENEHEIIKSHDDVNLINLAEQGEKGILLFRDASQAQDLFDAWNETYEKRTYHNLILGRDAAAYRIGIKPLKKHDLLQFTNDKDVSGGFKEILRHNAISDKENAFNKLLSLFICKMVDERERGEDDVVYFQYKYGEDDYYSLYERLLKLYQKGMKDYLGEDVFYLEYDYVSKAIDHYTGQNRDELEKELKDSFQKTKLFSCQVFAFFEMYNEKLFLQNGKVLVEVVELLQQYRISYTSKEQFLGDLFEQLLGQGFKQDEGQFFTPIPITRFVWNSLPYERFIDYKKDRKEQQYPKVIDFACGAGHFLIEGVSAVKDCLKARGFDVSDSEIDSEISDSFYGVDKDGRLTKASKIALFLNGAVKAHIKAMDGLEHDENELGAENTFDIVATNPPFSVDSFKAHLSRAVQKRFEVLKETSINSGDIQNAFVERLTHLLKPRGVVGIIMPSSFLNAVDASKSVARRIMLSSFAIKAIVCLADKTFSQTGTSVNILFLEKFDEPPKKAGKAKDNVTAIFREKDLKSWGDEAVLDAYLVEIGVSRFDYEDYIINQIKELRDWEASGNKYLVQYFKMFEKSGYAQSAIDANSKKTARNKKSDEEVARIIRREFYDRVERVEREKLYYFALTYQQKTLVVTAPKDNDEQKRFLGYVNSNSKVQKALTETEGLLTNRADRDDKTKIAYLVKHSFMDDTESVLGAMDATLVKFVKYYNLKDMMSFDSAAFNNTIRTVVAGDGHRKSKWGEVRLGEAGEIVAGQSPESQYYNHEHDGLPFYQGKKDFGKKVLNAPTVWTTDVTRESYMGDILMSVRAPVGNVNINPFDKICIGRGLAAIRVKDETLSKYLFAYLDMTHESILGHSNAGFVSISKDEVAAIAIPLPPLPVQERIVAECEAIDREYNEAQAAADAGQKEIEGLFGNVEGEKRRLGEVAQISRGASPRPIAKFLTADPNGVNWIKIGDVAQGEKYITSTAQKITQEGAELSKRVKAGDFIISNSMSVGRPYILKIDGCIHDGWLLMSNISKELNTDYLYYILCTDIVQKQIKDVAVGSVVVNLNTNRIAGITIPLPPLPIQAALVQKAEAIEERIESAMEVMAGCDGRKRAVIEREVY